MCPRPAWSGDVHSPRRAEVCACFGLSSVTFTPALDVIFASAEVAALVGIEQTPEHLADA